MSVDEKTGAKEGKAERRRLNYLKVRSKDLKQELAAVRKETAELREKLGIEAKAKQKSDDDD